MKELYLLVVFCVHLSPPKWVSFSYHNRKDICADRQNFSDPKDTVLLFEFNQEREEFSHVTCQVSNQEKPEAKSSVKRRVKVVVADSEKCKACGKSMCCSDERVEFGVRSDGVVVVENEVK